MLVEAQKEMHKNIDLHRKKFKKQIDDIDSQIAQGLYWEVVQQKKEIKELKKQINFTIERYKEPEENVFRFCQLDILKNLQGYLENFMDVLKFTIDEHERDLDVDSRNGS
jgi:hypothetical protein